jgi:hypothetical protein
LVEQAQEIGADEMDIFQSSVMQDLVTFKWETYAYKVHYTGAMMHLFYIGCLSIYIYTTFLIGTYGERTDIAYTYIMCAGIIYPFVYDTT